MFGHIDKSKGFLFCTHDLDAVLRNAADKARQEVESFDPNRLLNTAPEDLKNYLVQKYQVEPIRLLRDDWYADHRDMPVDVRYDRMRWIDDTSRPVMVPGERIEVRVPFEGEAELFFARPNTMSSSPPRAVIEKNELVLRYDSASDSAGDVRPQIDRTLVEIEQYLGWQRPMIEAHNNGLLATAAKAIEQRRDRLLAQSQRAASLGIPIKRREDAPKTYAIPTARKKAAPVLPPASTTPFTPEPMWAMEQYEQALKITQDMALVMERSPAARSAA